MCLEGSLARALASKHICSQIRSHPLLHEALREEGERESLKIQRGHTLHQHSYKLQYKGGREREGKMEMPHLR